MIRRFVAASVVLAASLSIARCVGSPGALATATVSQYCAALASYAAACAVTDPCILATVKECPTVASGYSAAALGALTTCLTGTSCGDAGTAAVAVCSEYWLASLTPTDAQARLAEGYCARCPSAALTASECTSAFYAVIDDAGTVFPGAGYPLLSRTDSVATSTATTCVPAAGDAAPAACAAFGACELEDIADATPPLPAACATDASASSGDDAD